MDLLIDSPILLHYAGTQNPMRFDFKKQNRNEFFISIITADELMRGTNHSKNPDQRTKRLAYVEAVLDHLPIIPIDRSIVRIHAEILSNLKKNHAKISLAESWIAATCVTYGLTLLTDDPSTFEPVKGLSLHPFAPPEK